MRKIFALLPLVFIFVLSACGTQGAQPQEGQVEQQVSEDEGGGINIGLIPSLGGINDGSFNQGAFEGMQRFANDHNLSYNYFMPAEFTDAGYLSAIELAILAGSEIVITPGFTFSSAIYTAQSLFPNVYFAILDTSPTNPNTGEEYVANNTVTVMYAEEEAGFLAGYAAVMEGHRSLGFIGGISMPPVSRFGHGFALGADYAAQSLGLAAGDVTVMYHYAMTFSPTPEVQTTAAAWFNGGVEVIFAAAGGAGASVMAAAEAQNGFVIGVDSDQSGDSHTVITSATKGIDASVYTILTYFVANDFPGGQILTLGAYENAVGLPLETSRFQNFTSQQYTEIFGRISSGDIIMDLHLQDGPSGINVQVIDIIVI